MYLKPSLTDQGEHPRTEKKLETILDMAHEGDDVKNPNFTNAKLILSLNQHIKTLKYIFTAVRFSLLLFLN